MSNRIFHITPPITSASPLSMNPNCRADAWRNFGTTLHMQRDGHTDPADMADIQRLEREAKFVAEMNEDMLGLLGDASAPLLKSDHLVNADSELENAADDVAEAAKQIAQVRII